MREDLDAPIALRRTPRRSKGDARTVDMVSTDANSSPASTFQTPSRTRTKKRVRFSDPGPEIASHNSPSSTGLTPMVRRTTLGNAVPSKRRRHSTSGDLQSGVDGDAQDTSNEVHFLSLRQVLDDRVKRRIRRNGLSEEMNIIDGEKRQRAQRQTSEIQRLRRELAQRDEEIEGLRNATVVQDTERILQLEEQIDRLRAELDNNQPEPADQTRLDWTMAAQDPFTDGYMEEDDVDEDAFGDTTMADLVCSTPTRARSSFPTPPCTSPMLPITPPSMRRQPIPPSSHTGVQAQIPDPEKEALEAELGSLRLELTKLNDTLASHEGQRERLSNKLSKVQLPTSLDRHRDMEEHLDQVLQSLSDKTAGLLDINSSLSALGFRGGDSLEIVASIANALRTARLELEYLTPGEITLPLSSHGAEVLDLVLVRLRDLSRQVKEDEASIDEYHALELTLRQQLGARVEAMDGLRREAQRSTARLEGKDARIAELEVGADRLKGAIEGYRRDISELETLVQRIEEEGQSNVQKLRSEVDAGKQEIKRKDNSARELEAKIASLLSQVSEIKKQLADAQSQRAALNRSHGTALALRDARVTELRGEIDGINAALRTAHETICQLRVQNVGLENSIDGERKKAKEAVDSMKAELARVLEMSEGILATPKKGGAAGRRSTRSSAGGSSSQSSMLASGGAGRKRRKYDSGLGFLSEEEGDI
ncbi:hypothetical protein PFICI_07925 [Pestalotiopsis fici W106-1]|uniref:Uncharacterized protein n=1 Tax=Pestalotiopsis fici (strain W106-1 / CGMCC3.15140) TaxID=1229662 RepID=W3X5D0_PESFW|nr:uncharacterized protein PFICI_07925 [Pestalotiopsis fici W106-1]ETS80396.1 hypothetical protein PFICI_07925 [Pestalotiopsis fici W106-1]